MDQSKVGAMILHLRRQCGMTQREVAEKLSISDKTVSKWERGLGCPDISLLRELSHILGVNIETLLSGESMINERDMGNMKRTRFYVCPECMNIISSSGNAEISCCGKRLSSLIAQENSDSHRLEISEVEDELYITSGHEMKKEHFISFVAAVSDDKCFIQRLYPEQNAAFRFPRMPYGRFYFYCSKHGLFMQKK